MKINLKTFVALKELHLLDSVEASFESLELITRAKTELIQSIYDSKPKLKDGEVFIETLLIKILLATKSIIELGKGTNVSPLTKNVNVKLLDFSSINIITRSIIEAFLTLEYLFFNYLNEDEKTFRFHVWQISGYKSRQNIFDDKGNLKENVKTKLKSEYLEIIKLKKEIEKSPYYKNIKQQSLYKLDTYGLPRLESWSNLLKQSILNKSIFEKLYKLYSNYAHSEFISLIQMNNRKVFYKNTKENNDAILNALRVVKMINCICIVSLNNKFNFALDVFEKFDKETKTTILFWNEFGTKKDSK